METERLAPASHSSTATRSSSLPGTLTKKTIGIGGATFTTFTTVLVVCLVLLVFTDSVSNGVSAEDISSPVTLHVLDTSTGKPAAGIYIELEKNSTTGWANVGSTTTDSSGRSNTIVPESIEELDTGVYRMLFYTEDYFAKMNVPTFYPRIDVLFMITNSSQSYHIPLILSPWGYTTYRGS